MLISVTYIGILSYRNDTCNRYQHCNFGEAQIGGLPNDGLCKPKHVGATITILNDFNSLMIL